ncbi:MAG: hypothetical protein NUV65_03545 [Candidatus Roizmanbacteria bacterium]|nr:hypothetical protein [Candidatus Roizmanbacteria bacterium]
MKDWKNKPTYQKDPSWFQERNKELVKDKQNGMSIADICTKYHMTNARMYTILKKQKDLT